MTAPLLTTIALLALTPLLPLLYLIYKEWPRMPSPPLPPSMESLFHKHTKFTAVSEKGLTDTYTCTCRRGLWAVTSTSQDLVQFESRKFFMEYYEDGAYAPTADVDTDVDTEAETERIEA